MNKKRQHTIRVRDHVFFFKYEADFPELLHIYSRHRKQPEDAVQIFFEFDEEKWNEEYERYETTIGNLGIYWYWINEEQKLVQIISFFDIT